MSWYQKHKQWVILGAGAYLVLAVIAGALVWRDHRRAEQEKRESAERESEALRDADRDWMECRDLFFRRCANVDSQRRKHERIARGEDEVYLRKKLSVLGDEAESIIQDMQDQKCFEKYPILLPFANCDENSDVRRAKYHAPWTGPFGTFQTSPEIIQESRKSSINERSHVMNRGGFSWNRLLGISTAKARLSRRIGVPLTRSGRQRKFGRAMGCMTIVVPVVVGIAVGVCWHVGAFWGLVVDDHIRLWFQWGQSDLTDFIGNRPQGPHGGDHHSHAWAREAVTSNWRPLEECIIPTRSEGGSFPKGGT